MEDSTFWNPSWTISGGAIQTTTIDDVHDTAIAVGTGALLSEGSYELMTSNGLIGRTSAVEGCTTCFPHSEGYSYGLGLVRSGEWMLQNPMFEPARGERSRTCRRSRSRSRWR